MSFKKLIGTMLVSSMLVSAFASVASAEVEFEYDEGYYISNVADAADRTPYIETSITKLTSDAVQALTGVSGITNKKWKDTAYGNTANWDVYQIDGTVKGVGPLGVGYDANDNAAYVKVKAIDAGLNFSSLTALGAKGTAWDAGVAGAVEENTGTAWTLKNDGSKGGCFLQLLDAFPNEDETAEGNLRDLEYKYTLYIVLPAGTSTTLAFDKADASVQYNVYNTLEGYSGDLIVNKIATRSADIKLPPIPDKTYTITFKSYDGTTDISSTVYNENDTVAAPTAPTRSGYTFSHWSETVGGSAATVLTTATANKTYYAVYTQDTPTPVPVVSVSLDQASLNFTVGDAAKTLVATVLPANADNKEVTWSSSNTAVATVANGVVTPVGVGNATITVTTTDGNKKATCNVTVIPANVPVTGVSLDQAALNFTVGDAAKTLVATVLPANATNKNVTWSSSNTAVATVANGVVTPVGEGTATITVTTEDGNKPATCNVTVVAPQPQETGIIKVSNVKGRIGTSVDVTLSLEDNPGIISMRLNVAYDSNALTLTKVTDANVLGDNSHNPDFSLNPYILYWNNGTSQNNITSNGTIVTLTFEIKDTAPVGDYAITISYDNSKDDILNYAMNPVNFAIENGKITAIDFIYGDVNKDDNITAKDNVFLARYIAKWNGYDETNVDLMAADVNADGKVTGKDNVILSRYIAKWNGYETLPYLQ